MENFYLSALVAEMRRQLTGRSLGRVWLSGAQVLFDLRPSDGRVLFVSLSRTAPALFLSSKSPKQFASDANSTPPFAAHLKKHAAGAEVVSITKPPLDRVVLLELERF